MSKPFKIFGNPIEFDTLGGSNIIDLSASEAKTLRIRNAAFVSPSADTLLVNKLSQKRIGNPLSGVQTLTQLSTANMREQGKQVAISENATKTFISVGSPYRLTDGYHGGVGVYKSTSNATFGIENYFEYNTFTNDAYAGEFTDIDESGTRIVFSDGEQAGNSTLCVVVYNGTTWVRNDPETVSLYNDAVSCKISGNYILAGDEQGALYIENLSGSTWSVQQTLVAPGSNVLISKMDIINNDTVYYYSFLQIKKFTRVATVWTNTVTIATSAIASALCCFGPASNMVMAYSDPTNVYVYVNDNLVKTQALAGIISMTTNGTNIFCASSTTIYTISVSSGLWTLSTSTTFLGGIYSISCNSNRLVVGMPSQNTYGKVNVYNISSTGLVDLNEIILDDGTTTDMTVRSNFGNVNITGGLISMTGAAQISGALAVGGTVLIGPSSGGQLYSTGTNNLTVATSLGIILSMSSTNVDLFGTLNLKNTSSVLTNSGTTDSTSITTGANVFSGGLGVAKTIFATTYSSPNNAFKFSSYQHTTAQSFTGSVGATVFFGTNNATGISTLTKTTVSGGSNFTTSIACKLLVCFSFRSTGTSNFGQSWIRVNSAGVFWGQNNAWAQAGQGNSLCGTAILNLAGNDYFNINAAFDSNCSISTNADYLASSLQVYSLN